MAFLYIIFFLYQVESFLFIKLIFPILDDLIYF